MTADVDQSANASSAKGETAMPVNKQHKEFHAVDLNAGWEVPPGYPPGIEQKILSGALNEANKTGSRTRLLRFQPGVYTTSPFVHDYWEEVYLIKGDLTVGNDEKGNGGTAYQPNTYAVRPPGAIHGPFKSQNGCMLVEIHYYDPV
jgi:hypothetical protein